MYSYPEQVPNPMDDSGREREHDLGAPQWHQEAPTPCYYTSYVHPENDQVTTLNYPIHKKYTNQGSKESHTHKQQETESRQLVVQDPEGLSTFHSKRGSGGACIDSLMLSSDFSSSDLSSTDLLCEHRTQALKNTCDLHPPEGDPAAQEKGRLNTKGKLDTNVGDNMYLSALSLLLDKWSLNWWSHQHTDPSKSALLTSLWIDVLPLCTADYLDLESVIRLRQTCTQLYYERQYSVKHCLFQRWCTLTEQELIVHALPQLRRFLTSSSLATFNFSHCCLLTDTFPNALMESLVVTSSFQYLKALYFDFCYALTDKSLEVLLKTSLPSLEPLLTSTRWPRFHQLSCSCTQVTLTHLDSAAEFLAERAVTLNVSPKLGISGSLASNSLIRRLGLEQLHQRFIDAIIIHGTVPDVQESCANFEHMWAKLMDGAAAQEKVLHRLVRHRASTILVNAPCSVAIVDDGEGHEKAIWCLQHRQGTLKPFNQVEPQTFPIRTSLECPKNPTHAVSPVVPGSSPDSSKSGTTQPAQHPLDNDNQSQRDSSATRYGHHDTPCDPPTMATQNSSPLHYVHYLRWSYPLPIAVRLGNLALVEFLIKKGTYVDVWGYNFATPLYIAGCQVTSSISRREHDHQCEAASTRLPTSHDRGQPQNVLRLPSTVLNSSQFKPSLPWRQSDSTTSRFPYLTDPTRLELVYFLLQSGAPVDAPDLYCVKCPVNAAIKNDNNELLELFLSYGATINVRALNKNVIPPLIQLSRRQQQKKQAPKSLTRFGYKSPLFFACELQAWRCVSVLLDNRADPHWRDPFSQRSLTPTLLAYRKDPSMLKLFVSKGAGSTHETRWVLSEVLAAAILQDDTSTINYLVSLYPDLLQRESSNMWSLPLHQSARLNKTLVTQELLRLGNQPNVENTEKLTPLHFAASEGHQDIIELLLQQGANPNVKGGPNMNTPLHMAVEENHIEAAQLLLTYNALSSIKNKAGMTPLMTAIVARHDKMAPLLIHHATVEELDTEDYGNRTALVYAINFCQFKVADILVEKGASVHIKDTTENTIEAMLKGKIHSLGKTSLSLNKIFWNIFTPASGSGSCHNNISYVQRMENDPDSYLLHSPVADKAEPGQASDESVRKLNAKRRRLAKQLLNKIRIRLKKTPHSTKLHSNPPPSVAKPVHPPARENHRELFAPLPVLSSLSSLSEKSDTQESDCRYTLPAYTPKDANLC